MAEQYLQELCFCLDMFKLHLVFHFIKPVANLILMGGPDYVPALQYLLHPDPKDVDVNRFPY